MSTGKPPLFHRGGLGGSVAENQSGSGVRALTTRSGTSAPARPANRAVEPSTVPCSRVGANFCATAESLKPGPEQRAITRGNGSDPALTPLPAQRVAQHSG
ncbi:hypothetical protein SAMN05421803_11542 [Nocardiopsis flavescens]|uniref:Uncharacterized protein n=1 Tax=Nocardiopsis flavescens TaxID=758803 RepID=A0A1M6QFR9_9ACTN|nr:hypothetical protein SAMN05421803_11542 [Nocardiopsis flavescens]